MRSARASRRSSISGSTTCWRAFGLRCAIMSRMRTRTATRAGGAAHCTRTAGTAWSNRRTSTVSSASFTRGSRGSSRVAGELVNLSRACALSCLMLGSPYPPGALEALAACARYLCGPAFTSDLAARVRAAGELGPRGGGERGRCVGIWDGGGFRNACGGENPVGRGQFVMLDIALQYGSTDHLRDGPTG